MNYRIHLANYLFNLIIMLPAAVVELPAVLTYASGIYAASETLLQTAVLNRINASERNGFVSAAKSKKPLARGRKVDAESSGVVAGVNTSQLLALANNKTENISNDKFSSYDNDFPNWGLENESRDDWADFSSFASLDSSLFNEFSEQKDSEYYELFTYLQKEEIQQFFKRKQFQKTDLNDLASLIADMLTINKTNPASLPAKRTFNEVYIYITVLICLVGIVGNMLSLKVFCSTKVPRTSSRCYLIALTISDAIFLISHFFDTTLKEIVDLWHLDFPLNISDQKVAICRSFALLRNACRAASPWIIVTFTLERFLVVIFPSHSHTISRPVLAKRFVFVIVFLSVVVSSYAPYMSGILEKLDKYKLNKFNRKIKSQEVIAFFSTASPLIFNYYSVTLKKSTCDVLPDYRNIYLYFTLFYMIVVIILPLVIVSLFNTLLILRLYKSNDHWTTTKLEMHEQELSYKELRDKKLQIENLKITWTLIIISASFIVLTLPYCVMYFVDKLYVRQAEFPYRLLSNQLVRVANLFYMLNHSINFFLYVLSRNSFRRVLKEKLKCDCMNIKHYYSYSLNPNSVELNMRWIPDKSNDNTKSNTKSSKDLNRSSDSSPRPLRGAADVNGKQTVAPQPVISRESYEQYWDTYRKSDDHGDEAPVQTRETSLSTVESKPKTQALKFDLLKIRMKSKN